MRQDKIIARILFIFSVANIALAAPVAVRQRHLDVARTASQKRGPVSDNDETGDSPPESSPPVPPHDGLSNGWAESSSAAASRIPPQASGAPGLDSEETVDSQPEPSSHTHGLTNGWAESSSAAANRITTQASGAPVWDNGAAGDLPPESSSRIPPHNSLSNGWLEYSSLPESSSAAANRIPTQASEAPGLDNEESVNPPPEPSSHTHGLTNGWAESSSTAANRITTQASGAASSSSGATGDLRPELSSPEPHPGLTLAQWASWSSQPSSVASDATGDLPPESSSRILPHDGLTNGWLDHASLAESSSGASDRTTTQASGAVGSGNEATGDLPPEPSSRISPHDGLTDGQLDHASLPESSSGESDRITTQASGAEGSGKGVAGDLPPESSSAVSDRIATQESGATASSSSESAHLGDMPPPHQGSAPESLAAPEADRLFGDTLAHKILVYSGVAAVIGGTAAALGYGIHKWTKHPKSHRDLQVPRSDVVRRGAGTHPMTCAKVSKKGI